MKIGRSLQNPNISRFVLSSGIARSHHSLRPVGTSNEGLSLKKERFSNLLLEDCLRSTKGTLSRIEPIIIKRDQIKARMDKLATFGDLINNQPERNIAGNKLAESASTPEKLSARLQPHFDQLNDIERIKSIHMNHSNLVAMEEQTDRLIEKTERLQTKIAEDLKNRDSFEKTRRANDFQNFVKAGAAGSIASTFFAVVMLIQDWFESKSQSP